MCQFFIKAASLRMHLPDKLSDCSSFCGMLRGALGAHLVLIYLLVKKLKVALLPKLCVISVFVAECHVDAHVLLSDLLISKLCPSMMTLLIMLFPCSIVYSQGFC